MEADSAWPCGARRGAGERLAQVMSIATKVDWDSADLFPNFGMHTLA
jgi:hypothetical protein